MGFVVAEVTDIAGLQSIVLAWQDVLTIKLFPVIDDQTTFKVISEAL